MPEAKTGDIVRVITSDGEQFEGILMPRPDILEKGIIVVKIDNGYNIGIDKNKIKKIEVIEEYNPKPVKKHETRQNKNLPNVSILSCGGTISSKVDYRTGGVIADYTAEDLLQMCPEIEKIANIKARKVMSIMSEDMDADSWSMIAKEIAKEFDLGADGVVVTQGTDTFHFTTAALSFLLKDLGKPVIFTASQRSIDRGSSDAFMNLICAVTAAAKFDIAEVATCLHGTTNDDYCLLLRGTKVRKMHSSRRDAFRPINSMPIAKIFPDGKIEVIDKNYKKRNDSKPIIEHKFEPKVAIVKTYPGMNEDILDFYAEKGFKGLVIEATGLGNVPQRLFEKLSKISGKIPVVITAETIYGRVHPLVYSNLRELSIKLNCIFAEDMLTETAYVKLGYVLGKTKEFNETKKLMLENIAGEISERSEAKTFLY